MSIAASREPWLSKPGHLITDLSNTALPATSSHRAAQAAAAEAERRICAEINEQRAAEGSPIITPPPETHISTTNQPLSPIEDDESEDKLDNLVDNSGPRDNLTIQRRSKKSKRAHNDENGQ